MPRCEFSDVEWIDYTLPIPMGQLDECTREVALVVIVEGEPVRSCVEHAYP